MADDRSCLPITLPLNNCMEINPKMSEILAESIRVVGALLGLAGDSEQLFPGIRQTAARLADLHDFLKLGQLEIIKPFGIVGVRYSPDQVQSEQNKSTVAAAPCRRHF